MRTNIFIRLHEDVNYFCDKPSKYILENLSYEIHIKYNCNILSLIKCNGFNFHSLEIRNICATSIVKMNVPAVIMSITILEHLYFYYGNKLYSYSSVFDDNKSLRANSGIFAFIPNNRV